MTAWWFFHVTSQQHGRAPGCIQLSIKVLLNSLQLIPKSFTCMLCHVACAFLHPGMWKDQAVAVKIVTHTSAEEPRITRELSLAQQLEHPHLVKTLHFARMTLKHHGAGSPVST
jgi:hypothetical protein